MERISNGALFGTSSESKKQRMSERLDGMDLPNHHSLKRAVSTNCPFTTVDNGMWSRSCTDTFPTIAPEDVSTSKEATSTSSCINLYNIRSPKGGTGILAIYHHRHPYYTITSWS